MSTPWPNYKLREIAEIRVSNVDKKYYSSELPARLCYGLHRKKQMPFFRSFKREFFDSMANDPLQHGMVAEPSPPYGFSEEEKISILVDLTQQVYLVVERELKLVGFWESIPARNKLKADIQTILIQPAYIISPNMVQKRAQIISRVSDGITKSLDS